MTISECLDRLNAEIALAYCLPLHVLMGGPPPLTLAQHADASAHYRSVENTQRRWHRRRNRHVRAARRARRRRARGW